MFKKFLVAAALCLALTFTGTAKAEVEVDLSHSHYLNTEQNSTLSRMAFITTDKVYMYLYSGISVADFVMFSQDLIKLRDYTEYRDITLVMNSPGGSAFDGLSLSDMIVRYQEEEGFTFTVRASGIVASAAVPIFAVCKYRTASPGTLFMVHEAALWKWPGRETSSDIIAQGELMKKLQSIYLTFLVNNSTMSMDEWKVMEKKTTWFTVEQARKMGLIERKSEKGGHNSGRK